MPFRLGPLELGILLAIVVIIFGVGKLPEIGSAAGRAIRGFRKEVKGQDGLLPSGEGLLKDGQEEAAPQQGSHESKESETETTVKEP